MRAHVRLGRVAGIPIGLNVSTVVVVALFAYLLAVAVLPAAVPGLPADVAWAAGLATSAAFFATLLAHEVAHALVARRCGVEVRQITLWMLGGVTELGGEPATPRQALAVAVAGPAVSLTAGAALLGAGGVSVALGAPALLPAALVWLGATNVLLAVFNLLPAAPLDGGRVVAALVWWRTGDRERATRAAAAGGRLVGQALVLVGLVAAVLGRLVEGLWLGLMGWFLLGASSAEGRSAAARTRLTGLTVADVMTAHPVLLPGYLTVDGALAHAAPMLVHDRQDLCGVVDFDGRPLGLVALDVLLAVAPQDRAGRRVADLVVPAGRLGTVTPDDPMPAAADRLAAGRPALVVDQGRLVGLLTPDDLRWALRGAAAGSSRAGHENAPPPSRVGGAS